LRAQVVVGGDRGMRQPLVFRQLEDQLADQRDVVDGRGADADEGVGHGDGVLDFFRRGSTRTRASPIPGLSVHIRVYPRQEHAFERPQPAGSCFTSLLTRPMSACPASAGLSTPISLPMSAAEDAPVASIALSISARIAASSIFAGR